MNIAVGEEQRTCHLITEYNERPIWPTAMVTIARGNALVITHENGVFEMDLRSGDTGND